MNKVSIRFFDDREVRAVWDEQNSKWWFSVVDVIGVLTDQNDYNKNRNYWKYLKAKLKKEKSEVVSFYYPVESYCSRWKKSLKYLLI